MFLKKIELLKSAFRVKLNKTKVLEVKQNSGTKIVDRTLFFDFSGKKGTEIR